MVQTVTIGWSRVKLKEICRTTSGGTPSRTVASYYNGDIPWVKSGELNDGPIFQTEEHITEAAVSKSSAKVFPSGTLLIALYGATVGRLGVLKIDATTNQAVCAIFTDGNVERDFLFYYLLKQRAHLIESRAGGAQPNISQNTIRNLEIPLPPLPEQKRIAAILTKADRLRRLRRYAHDLSDSYLQSVFLEMFGDPASNPMGWRTLDFGEVISIISGHGFKRAEYSNNGVRLLQIANVSFQEIIWDALAHLPTEYLEHYPKLVLKPGDLLMALNRPILGHRIKFAVLKEDDCPAILYQRVGKFVIKAKQLHRDYLYGFMLTDYFYRELKVRLAGSDQPYINPTELVKMRFVLPSLSLQRQFARIVYKFERLHAQQREA